MANFAPAYKVGVQSWIPAIKSLSGAILALGGLLTLEMAHEISLPQGAPAGVVNLHGVCYLASVIQLLDSARYASGEALEGVLNSGGSKMLEAYRDVHADIDVFRGATCINPDKLVAAWVEAGPEEYRKPYIIKQTEKDDGSFCEEELCPGLVGKGVGGDPNKLLRAIMTEFNARCKDLKKANPFQLSLAISQHKTEHINVLWYDATGTSDQKSSYDFVHWDGNIVKTNYRIAKAPKKLLLTGINYEKHAVPLHVTLRDSKEVAGSYRLLGIIYGLPIIDKEDGVKGNHAIAVVRYGDTWYECDNHRVKPYATERDFVDMVDSASRVTYHGAGIDGGTIPYKYPMVVMYELQ